MTNRVVSLRLLATIIVLAWAGAAAGQTGLLDFQSLPSVPAGPPVTYGTAQTSFVTIPEWDFDPPASTVTYSDVAIGGVNARRFQTGGFGGFLAGVHLPDGAILTSIEFDLCDSSASAMHWAAPVESCASVDGLCAIMGTPLASVSNPATPCAAYTQDLTSLNYVVDNGSKRLLFIVLPTALDNTNSFAGAVVGYKLQVSPAPGTATFGDVPTSHPFFQFIEALAKSGITAGCGGGNYCPNNPVTRGQMAVFLAKGLGLQFP